MPKVHFEIFRQAKRGGAWALIETMAQRDEAVSYAKRLVEEGVPAVRVVKETHTPETGDYLTLTIFEHGATETKTKSKKLDEGTSTTPCFKPDDLYSHHARATMARILGDWLAAQKLTLTELIHNARALEKFESAGTVYQHAIQKVAVAQASESESSVTQIVKHLDGLCTAAIHRVYKDERRGLFPLLEAGQFGPFAERLGASPDARYALNGALAKYLRTAAPNWDAKLQSLFGLMKQLPAEGPGRALLLNGIDTLVAEMLTAAGTLAGLLGPNPDLGHALMNLVELFLGGDVHVAEGGLGIHELARFFAKDELPVARQAIATRIVAELKGMKRLCPKSIDEEFRTLRRLGNQLIQGQGKYLSNEDIVAAFHERSKRLVTDEPLLQFMQNAKTSDERLERLLVVEENIVGAENKRNLASFMVPMIISNGFENQLCSGAPIPQRLRRVAELQERVLRSGFQDVQKNQIAVALDAVAQRIDERSRFLASIEAKTSDPIDRVETLLRLCTAGVFTQGDLMMKARRLLMGCLTKPGFLSTYIAHLECQRSSGSSVDRDQVLANLATQLEKIGVAQEDAMRALAA
jgi:hypothetical protein